MTDQELKQIRDDLSLITEGKWFRYNDETSWVAAWDEENECDTPVCECHELEDAMFIEKAPEYVRRLLTEVERLRSLKEAEVEETSRVEILLDTGDVLAIKAIEFKVSRTSSGDVESIEWTVEKGTPNPLYINPAHVIAITEEKVMKK